MGLKLNEGKETPYIKMPNFFLETYDLLQSKSVRAGKKIQSWGLQGGV